MTTMTLKDPTDTCADWLDIQHAQVKPNRTPEETPNTDTATQPFEHFEADVQRLGQSKDRYGTRWGAAFRRSLGEQIKEARDPMRWVEIVVRHCCERPSQLKIEDGSDVLSEVSRHLLRFIEDRDLFDFPNQSSGPKWYNRVWLYADAMGLAGDSETRADRIRILCKWLSDSHSSVRESAANALGVLKAAEAEFELSKRLSLESDSTVREAISDALTELGDAS